MFTAEEKRPFMRAPVLKDALLNTECYALEKNALAKNIPDLERLLMVNSDAPALLDSLVLTPNIARSKILVTVVSKAYTGNPSLAPMIRRVGPAMQEDRAQRGTGSADVISFVESVREIVRIVPVVKPSYPRY